MSLGATFERFERMLKERASPHGSQDDVKLTYWKPNSNRKHRVRQFIIAHVADRPVAIAKIRTDPADDKVGRELRIIHSVPSVAGEGSDSLFVGDEEGFAMPFVGQCNLATAFEKNTALQRAKMVEDAIETLIRFHSQSPRLDAPLSPDQTKALLGRWRPSDPDAARVLTQMQAGAMHGDSGVWNFQSGLDGLGTTLIDWEDFRHAGLQPLDVLNLLLTLTLLVHPDHATKPKEYLYRATFLEDREMKRLLRNGLDQYCTAMGTAPADCLALIPVYCRNMLRRFELEDRPTDHLFYKIFLEFFDYDTIRKSVLG